MAYGIIKFESWLGDDVIDVKADVTIIEGDSGTWASDIDYYGTREASIMQILRDGVEVDKNQLEQHDLDRIETEAIEAYENEMAEYEYDGD